MSNGFDDDAFDVGAFDTEAFAFAAAVAAAGTMASAIAFAIPRKEAYEITDMLPVEG